MRDVAAIVAMVWVAACAPVAAGDGGRIVLPLTFEVGQVYEMEVVRSREETGGDAEEGPRSARFVSRIEIQAERKDGFRVSVTTEPGFLGAVAGEAGPSGLPSATIEYLTDIGLTPLRLADRDAITSQIDALIDTLAAEGGDPERGRLIADQFRERLARTDDEALAQWLGEDLVAWSLFHGIEIGVGEVLTEELVLPVPLLATPVEFSSVVQVVSATPSSVVLEEVWEPTSEGVETIGAAIIEMWEAAPGTRPITPEEREMSLSFEIADVVTVTHDRASGVATAFTLVEKMRIGPLRRIDRAEATIRRIR